MNGLIPAIVEGELSGNIFINENKADILISLLHNEFVKIIKDLSNDEQNILVKDNKRTDKKSPLRYNQHLHTGRI